MGAENKYTSTDGNGIGQNYQLQQQQQQQQYFYSTHAPPQSPSAPPHDHQHPSDHDQRINVTDAYYAYAYAAPTAANPAPPNYVKLETALPTVVVVDEHSQQEPSRQLMPCCGIGIGWALFMLGFIFPFVWIGGGILLCTKYDRREKSGYVACSVMGVIFVGLLIFKLAFTVYVFVYLNQNKEHYI